MAKLKSHPLLLPTRKLHFRNDSCSRQDPTYPSAFEPTFACQAKSVRQNFSSLELVATYKSDPNEAFTNTSAGCSFSGYTIFQGKQS